MSVELKPLLFTRVKSLDQQVKFKCFLFVSLWLRNNEPEATKKHKASLPRRDELSRLKTELCHMFDLEDIR